MRIRTPENLTLIFNPDNPPKAISFDDFMSRPSKCYLETISTCLGAPAAVCGDADPAGVPGERAHHHQPDVPHAGRPVQPGRRRLQAVMGIREDLNPIKPFGFGSRS